MGYVLNAIGQMLKAFLKELKSQMKNNDHVRLVIISPELKDPLGLPNATVADINVKDILQCTEKVLQSNEHFYLHKGVTTCVRHVVNPQGGRGRCQQTHGQRHMLCSHEGYN